MAHIIQPTVPSVDTSLGLRIKAYPSGKPSGYALILRPRLVSTSGTVSCLIKLSRTRLHWGSSMLLLFIFWGALPKIEKNVKICLNTFSRNYLCQKIVKGGWQSWIFRDPLNSTKFGCFTKITCRSPIVKVRYKCYTFSETSGQPLKGGEERKVKNGQEN